MESFRFFVANLPVKTTETDLKLLFQNYGHVKNIELKTKENFADPDDIKIIAFVTLDIREKDTQRCLNDLNWEKVQGQKIKVSLAKESFLERLKREREEAKTDGGKTLPETKQHFDQESDLLQKPQENKRKVFDVYDELDDEDVAAELMINKKRAASSMHSGKIVIQSQDVQPIHVIETKRKKKHIDNKSSSADQKRKESLNKMKNQYQQKKTAIQQALQGLDSKQSKKIKFSDAESDLDETDSKQKVNELKTNIFGSEGDSEEDENYLKSICFDKRGEKLVQMQAKQSLDPRFHIDAKFVDDDEINKTDDKNVQENSIGVEGFDNERQWQMNILEQVVGTKLDAVYPADKSRKTKNMLRYDPSKDEHKIYERQTEDTQINGTKQIKKNTKDAAKNKNTDTKSNETPEVSKEVFYVVTDTLQESLRTRGEGFSLLKMFGNTEHLEQRDENLKQLENKKILVEKKFENVFMENPFGYDSSSESENELIATGQTNIDPKNINDIQNTKKFKKNIKIATESFFIPKNDIRLKEGAKFFIYKNCDDTNTENYEEVRNSLKLLIKTKVTKAKRNFTNAGYKGKRKVKT